MSERKGDEAVSLQTSNRACAMETCQISQYHKYM